MKTGVIAMFRRHHATTGRHRHAGDGPVAVPGPVRAAPDAVVDDARARLDPVTCPIPLPVPLTVPGARLRPQERRLIRTV